MMKKLRDPALLRATPLWLLLPPLLLMLISACSFDLDYDKYAVVVGVADYPGSDNDLGFPDDDARDMRDLLVAQGFQVTLLVTDDTSVDPDEASYTNLQAAFASVAAIISEDDLFLFYFSGHGGYSASASPETTENASGSDSYDESIALVNDSLTGIYDIRIQGRRSRGGFEEDPLHEENSPHRCLFLGRTNRQCARSGCNSPIIVRGG